MGPAVPAVGFQWLAAGRRWGDIGIGGTSVTHCMISPGETTSDVTYRFSPKVTLWNTQLWQLKKKTWKKGLPPENLLSYLEFLMKAPICTGFF